MLLKSTFSKRGNSQIRPIKSTKSKVKRKISSIPYHPKLALGNILNEETFTKLKEISDIQAPVDAAQDSLNELFLTRKAFDLTLKELKALEVEIDQELIDKRDQIDGLIKDAAKNLATLRFDSRPKIDQKMVEIGGVLSKSIESPLDYNKSQIKKMDLSADSMKMDAKYFSRGDNQESANNYVSSIKSFVSFSARGLGTSVSGQASAAAQSQAAHHSKNKNLVGTLVITATCTHKSSNIFAPLIIDVDKGIRAWNAMYKDEQIKLPEGAMEIHEDDATENDEKSINIISGATYGSTFVGMVHILKTEQEMSDQRMQSISSSLQVSAKKGLWFSSVKGGFGIDGSFASDVKNLLSSQDIQSYVSLVTMGVIPNIKSNQVQIGVREFADFDPAKMMDKLATFASATNSENRSLDESATAARVGGQMVNIRAKEIQGVMTGLKEIDYESNKMLDINSLMTAFEDYVDKCIEGKSGVPITYWVKPIKKAQLAKMWVNKYFPGEFMMVGGGDDSEKEQNPTPPPGAKPQS